MSTDTAVVPHAVPAGSSDEAARRAAVEALGVLDTAATERFDRITRLGAQAFGTDAVRIHIVDRDRVWAKSQTDDGPQELPRDITFCNIVVELGEPVWIPDLREDPRFADNPIVLAEPGARFYAAHPVFAPGGEAVGVVCTFDETPREVRPGEVRLLRDMARWVEDELRAAQEAKRTARLQQGLLPKRLESLAGYDLAGASVPLDTVGGDFYDWYPVRSGVAVTLADVMGKGAPAAIVAATVRAVMRAGSRVDGLGAALEAAAETLDADLSEADAFVTLFHAHLDEVSGVLRYVDAGHGLSLVVRMDGTSERLAATTMPLGTTWDELWDERRTVLRPGDTLVSVSDGVLDALGGTLASLDEVAALCRTATTAQGVVDAVLERVGPLAPDDVTVLVLRRRAAISV